MLWLNGFYNEKVYLSNRICTVFSLRSDKTMSDQREESGYLLVSGRRPQNTTSTSSNFILLD